MDVELVVGSGAESAQTVGLTSTITEAPSVTTDTDTLTEYRVYPKSGLELIIDSASSRVTSVFLKDDKDGTYQGDLPNELSFAMNRAEVRRLIGRPPDESKDKYRYDTWEQFSYKLRVEYQPDFNRIAMIVLMAT